MKMESHRRSLKESLNVLDEAIKSGIAKRQKTIGFHCSSAACDLIEMMLHKKNLVSPGFKLQHEWFLSQKKIKEKLPFDFPMKKRIVSGMMFIEEKRNLFCYGRPQSASAIQALIEKFNEFRDIFSEMGIDEGEG